MTALPFMWRRLAEAAIASIAILAATEVHAADTVISNVAGTHFGADGNEAAVGLTWQHALDAGGFMLGLSGTEFPIGSLTEVDADAYWVHSARLSITGGVSLGEAVSTTQGSSLYKVRLYFDSQPNEAWVMHAGYQYIKLDLIQGNLLTASIEYRPTSNFGLKVGAGYDAHGSFADRHGLAEVDWYGPERVFAGIVIGRTGYDPANLGQATFEERLSQIYLGASIPISLGTLTVGVDTLSLADASRQTLRVGLMQPIKP